MIMKLSLCVYRLPQDTKVTYLSTKSASFVYLNSCEGSATTLSPSYLDHGAIGRPGNLKHPSMRGLFAVHGCRDDEAQIVLAGILPHGVPQADLVRPKQAHLHQTWHACRGPQATYVACGSATQRKSGARAGGQLHRASWSLTLHSTVVRDASVAPEARLRGEARGRAADLEVAVSHEAQAVAVTAEGLGHGGDEGDAAPEAGHPEVLGNLAPGILPAAARRSAHKGAQLTRHSVRLHCRRCRDRCTATLELL